MKVNGKYFEGIKCPLCQGRNDDIMVMAQRNILAPHIEMAF